MDDGRLARRGDGSWTAVTASPHGRLLNRPVVRLKWVQFSLKYKTNLKVKNWGIECFVQLLLDWGFKMLVPKEGEASAEFVGSRATPAPPRSPGNRSPDRGAGEVAAGWLAECREDGQGGWCEIAGGHKWPEQTPR